MTTRRWLLAVGALVALLLVASVALFFVDERLRRYTEAKMNASLDGYTATIGRMHFTLALQIDETDLTTMSDSSAPTASST